jgi:hypothetical protein
MTRSAIIGGNIKVYVHLLVLRCRIIQFMGRLSSLKYKKITNIFRFSFIDNSFKMDDLLPKNSKILINDKFTISYVFVSFDVHIHCVINYSTFIFQDLVNGCAEHREALV